MGSNGYRYRFRMKTRNPFHGDAQFRRRATPEQIRRSRRYCQEIGSKGNNTPLDLFYGEIIGLRIHQQSLMLIVLNLIAGKQQLQRHVRVFTSKVGGAGEVPIWIDQRELHPALPESWVAMANAAAGTMRRSNWPMISWFSSQKCHRLFKVC